MSDRMDAVLANIDQALDGADDDWTVSGDAMRWTPPGQQQDPPPRPVDRYTMGRASNPPSSMAVPMRNGARTNAELADGVDLTPYLVGFDGAHPGTVYCAPVTNPDAGIPIGVIRPDGNVITERLPLPGPEPEPTPEEFRRRALEARRSRGTGPQRRDNRRWRNT